MQTFSLLPAAGRFAPFSGGGIECPRPRGAVGADKGRLRRIRHVEISGAGCRGGWVVRPGLAM